VKYIFVIAAFNALFFAVLLIQKKSKSFHDKILFFWLLYLGFYTGVYALFSTLLFTAYPLLSAAFISLLMLHGPFLYLYIRSLINQTPKFLYMDLWHFVPFVLFNFFLIVVSFLPEIAVTIRLDHVSGEYGASGLFHLFLIATALSGPVYFGLSLFLFKKLDVNIANNFSSIEHINLDWLRKLVYTFGVVWTILMAAAAIHHIFHLFSWVFCTDGLSLSLSVFIILIGYFGLKQKEIFSGYGKDQFVTEGRSYSKYAGSMLKETDAEIYAQKLKTFMVEKKPFLDPNLNLPELANELNIPSHYVSQVINKNIGQNFFDFINRYRVEEVKAKIIDPEYQKYSVLGIAYEAGFNSKSAFNRVFKNITGQTPSSYKKQHSW
jgi:AraC-like DNA-binding protein